MHRASFKVIQNNSIGHEKQEKKEKYKEKKVIFSHYSLPCATYILKSQIMLAREIDVLCVLSAVHTN